MDMLLAKGLTINKCFMRNILSLTVLWWGLCLPAAAKVVVYPRIVDKQVVEHEGYRVYVRECGSEEEWQELQVFQVEVDMDNRRKAAMAQFDMDGAVDVKVCMPGQPFARMDIRPAARGVSYQKADDRTVVFTLAEPAKLSIEPDGDRFHNLHLFANPLETETYDGREADGVINWDGGSHDIFRKDCKVIYFGPGVHQPKDLPNNEISIPGNCTVYLAPGALLKARLRVDRVENVKILGRGMLWQPLRGVEITHSRNVTVEGITVVNPQHYTVFGGGSEHVAVRNVKGFSSRGWSDGIDLMSCRNWAIDDVFLRTSDDCLAFYNHRWWYWGDSRNIAVQNSVLWADVAHAMNVGVHGDDMSEDGETLSDVVFRNIDVLNVDEDDDGYRGVMSVCSGDKNKVRNVLFENIRVEDCEEARLIDLRVSYNEKYNRAPGGRIENIVFRNISYWGGEGQMYPSRMSGYDERSDIRNVVLDNVRVNGVKMKDTAGMEINGFVSDVQVR